LWVQIRKSRKAFFYFIPLPKVKNMVKVKFQATEVFNDLLSAYNENIRGICLEGGSRSSKTFSIIQFIILYCQINQGKNITIARAKFTWLQASVIQDFFSILKGYGLYNEKLHSRDKSNYSYVLNNNRIYFVGLDDAQRLHGLKHDLFWVNEAIEMRKDEFDQLDMRCSGFYILDYNPSRVDHFVYNLASRKENRLFLSTQLKNPFLPEVQRKAILSYEPTAENIANGTADEVKWKVYGKGERAQYIGNVFNGWKFYDDEPENPKWIAYGCDLGVNDPCTFVQVTFTGNALYLKELIYETGLTNDVFLNKITDNFDLGTKRIISEIDKTFIISARKRGLQINQAIKKAGSILEGIQLLKKYPVYLHRGSGNAWREYQSYVWRENVTYDGGQSSSRYLDEPIDSFNHFIDAARYVVYFHSYILNEF